MNIDFEISRAHMTASNWEIETYQSLNPYNTIVFYLVDFSLGLVKLITMNNQCFTITKPLDLRTLVGSISMGVLNWSKSDLSLPELNSLCFCLNSYLQQTKTFEVYKHKTGISNPENLHVIFNLYRKNKSSDLTMRPVIVGDDCKIRSAKEIIKIAREVRHIDSVNRKGDQLHVTDLINGAA